MLLGLEHPHSDWHGSGLLPGVPLDTGTAPGSFNLNSTLTTLMSYRILPEFEAAEYDGLMAFDIAALQYLYGMNACDRVPQ